LLTKGVRICIIVNSVKLEIHAKFDDLIKTLKLLQWKEEKW